MGDTKLFVLLLLYAVVFTDADGEAVCLLAKRYKSFHKYEYLYESESLNTLNGAVNGPKVSCKVEIEVPRTCHFMVRTRECWLSEVVDVDSHGNPVFQTAAGTENFAARMEKNPLKVVVEGDDDIKLFPEDGELVNILNIKRGIVSALAVPALQDGKNAKTPTVYGLCETEYSVNASEDVATDVTLSRDLSRCEQFRPIRDHTSPLALITGMQYPLAQLIRSRQTCSYKFDGEKSHMTSGVCTEDHLLLPFSHSGKYGVSSAGKQTLSLLGVSSHNERVFDHNESNMKPLHLDESVDKSHDKDAVLAVLRELAGLSRTADGHNRARLAYELVAGMRRTNADALFEALPEALEISASLTYQALFQCGSPECSSVLMRILRTKGSPAQIDAAVFAMGMVPNPSPALVKEMLTTAMLKPSKLAYYATSNAVRRLYKTEGRVTPEIQSVADYVLETVGDCSGDQDHIYLTLRVTGNMAEAVGAASPALKSAVIRCVTQAAASAKVQQAAIQVFRLTSVPEEGRPVLMQVLLDAAAPVQKRIAAYLILMKEPQPAELERLAAALPGEGNLQVKSFVVSHLTNILNSAARETEDLKQKILDAFHSNEVGALMDAGKFSRNYKVGPLEGNVMFGEGAELPTEVMLGMTLNAFGYDVDMVEVGAEGKGFEPTVEALFGANGFFPDTVMKTVYYAADKMPSQLNEILKTMTPASGESKKRAVPKNIIREISKNLDKLFKNLKSNGGPEAMFYLRLLGAELGYLETTDLEEMAHSVRKVAENLLRTFPTDFIRSLSSGADGELFLHYIFMDNEFYLPTGPGLPLRVVLSGTFTPGVKGGLRISPDLTEIAFMPSAGVEFVTEIGAHLPDYVQSGLEIHTNIYHESGLRAKVGMTAGQIKLTIPAPEGPVKVLSVSNSLLSVAAGESRPVPSAVSAVDRTKCSALLPGVKYCTVLQYADATPSHAAPYFPLSGDSKFALELHPTADVSEYTATINYGHEENADKLTFNVKAEGSTFEANSQLMFNRKEHSLSAELQIPDLDIRAGIRVGAADPSTEHQGTRSIQIDLINKEVPQASLIGRAKMEAMKDVLLQLQLLVPALETDAKVTARLTREEELEVELESELKLFDASSVQKLVLNYDHARAQVQIKSHVSAKTQSMVSRLKHMKAHVSDMLDQNMGQTRTKICAALASSVTATNSLIKSSKIPYVEHLRVPSLYEFEVPETLFLDLEAGAKYHFGKHHYTIGVPLPLGGKSSKDLNFPPALTTPHLAVPQLGVNIASSKVALPEFLIPESLTVTLPTLGKAEVVGKLSSNVYDLEASVSAGRDSDEHQSYSAEVAVIGSGPVDLLSFKIQGSALMTGLMTDVIKAEMESAVSHKLIEARISMAEEIQLKQEVSLKSSRKLKAESPLGVKFSLDHESRIGVDMEKLTGENHLKASLVAGPTDGDVIITQSLALQPFKPEARIHSTIEVGSKRFRAQNKFVGRFANMELSVVSNTGALEDMLRHNAAFTLTRSKCALTTDIKAFELNIRQTAEANVSADDVRIRIETLSSHPDSNDHFNSVIVGTLNINGLDVRSDASVQLAEHTASHKASVTLDKTGLTTSGTTAVNSVFNLQNTFSGVLHSSKVSLSAETKGNFKSMAIDNVNAVSATMSSVALSSQSRVDVAENVYYVYGVSLRAEPYAVAADATSHLKLASDSELKSTCEVKLAGNELSGNAKCSTTGKLAGAHISHEAEMEMAGLEVRLKNNARLDSRLVRFSTALEAAAASFTFNVHALANGDGELHVFGKHSPQVYSKVLLRVEPFALAHSHECRFSTTHELDNEVIFETNVEKKFDAQLSVSEQSAKVTVKSKINSNMFNQEVSVYNNDERIGVEVSGKVTLRESQDFSMSALVQYDKNSDSHVINLPLLQSLPAILENLKMMSVTLLEAMRDCINREEFVAKLQVLQQYVADSVHELHLEEKVDHLKKNLIRFLQNCPVTAAELETAVANLRVTAASVMVDLNNRVGDVRDSVIQKVTWLNEQYDVKGLLLAVIEAIGNVIKQIDMAKLKDSLPDGGNLEDIKLHLQQYMTDLKSVVADFDKAQFEEQIQNIRMTTGMYTERLLATVPAEDLKRVANTLKQMLVELDILGKCEVIYSSFREVLLKYELHQRAEEFLDKLLELIKQLKISETLHVLHETLRSVEIPFPRLLDDALAYLRSADVQQIVDDLNSVIETFVKSLKSFEYNAFVDEANQRLSEFTAELNRLIGSLGLSQKLEATREFINYALSSLSAFLEELSSASISDIVHSVKTLVLDDVTKMAEGFKQKVVDMDIRQELLQIVRRLTEIYSEALSVLIHAVNNYVETASNILGDQPLVSELKQIADNLVTALKTSEIEIPSFTVPLTDLVVPSWKLQDAQFPEQFSLPQFTILGSYTVPAITITYNDIKQLLLDIADFLIHFDIKMVVNNAYPDKLSVYLHDLPSLALPAVTLPHISFPAIPKLSKEHMPNIPLQIPDIKLPKIPKVLVLPAFGNLHGRIQLDSPVFTFNTNFELRNSTNSEQKHLFTALVTSVGESSSFNSLNYNLDAAVHVGLPKMSRVTISDTLKFIHGALVVDHKASAALYGLSAQATAKTTVKVTTTPYTANIVNRAFLAVEGGMSASYDTSYEHRVNVPLLSLSGEAALTQSAVILQKGATIKLTVANTGTGAFDLSGYSDGATHKSDLQLTIAPTSVKVAFTGDTELKGVVSGALSNAVNVMVDPNEIDVDIKNKGDGKVSLPESLSSEFHIANDYGVIVNHMKQRISTAALLHFSHNKLSYNFTAENTDSETGMSNDNGLVVRVSATSTSDFKELEANVVGTSSLSLTRGLKLANTLSLISAYIKGTHSSTVTVSTEHLEAAVATVAHAHLPVFSIEVNHKLHADTKSHPIAESALTIKHEWNLPVVMLVGDGAVEHFLKVDGDTPAVSVESATKGRIDGRFLKTGVVAGALDNEATVHMSGQVLRSKLRTIGNVNVNYGDLKVEFDVNKNFDVEAEHRHVNAAMNLTSTNEVSIAAFNTKGKHAAKASIDLLPVRHLTANVEADLSQPGTLGDFGIYEKLAVSITALKQEISCITRLRSPVYSTNAAVEMEGSSPVVKVSFKSSAKSPVRLLDYDLDSYLSTSVENDVLTGRAKAVLEHDDFTVDLNSVCSPGDSSHSLSVDITSATFTDVNLRFAARREEVTASISSPSAGFLGYQLQNKLPAQLSSRLYSHYASAPETASDILTVSLAAAGDEKLRLQADCNLHAPKEMILGLRKRSPLITASISNFVEKSGVLGAVNRLKTPVVGALNEAYSVSSRHAPHLSQLSVLYRNVIVQYSNAVQQLLDAAVTFLRETQVRLPGMEETTLPEICRQIRSRIADMFNECINAIFGNLKDFSNLHSLRIALPNGDVVNVAEILTYVENTLTHSVNTITQLDGLEVLLQKLGQVLHEAVEGGELFVDMIQSDWLDMAATEINGFYTHHVRLLRNLMKKLKSLLSADGVSGAADRCVALLVALVKELQNAVSAVVPADSGAAVHFNDGRLKMDIWLPFCH